MRGSAAFRSAVAPGGVLAGPWVKNALWRRARAVPSLDLRFAENKSLVNATTGQNLVTFTRASSGTYVDSQGVIRTATTNLLLRSEEFDNASWSKLRLQAFGSGSVVDAAASPIGTLTAEKITEDSTTGFHYVQPLNGSTVASGATITASIYAKASERIGIAVFPYSSAAGARFNLSLGTVHSVDAGVTASIQNVGNGWYRCIASITAPGTSATPWFLILNAAFGTSYAGDGTSGILVWGAQLEQSSTVGEYIPTTSTINSAPRFDHNPTTGESLGLLVEEQRTNNVLQSEDFATTWTTLFSAVVTTNQSTSPAGTQTADKLFLSSSNRFSGVRQLYTFLPSTAYTLSVWARSVLGSSAFGLKIYDGVSDSFSINFNLTESWQRYTFTVTTAAGAGAGNIQIMNISVPVNQEIFIWGAQLEAGAFPTSYIPTTTAAATRSADVASITGTNFSSWYRQDAQTWFGEYAPVYNASATVPASTSHLMQVYNLAVGTNNYAIRGANNSVNQEFIARNPTAGSQFPSNSGIGFGVAGTNRKVSFGIDSSTLNVSTNGAINSVANNAAALMATHDILSIGSGTGGSPPYALNGTIRRLTYWPQRLPNSTLQQITQ